MEPIRQTPPPPAAATGAHSAPQARADAAERLAEGRPPQLAAPAAAAPAAAPLRRGLPGLDNRLQGDVASAQQALEFLDEVAGQLQALKGDLSAKLAKLQADERQIEARLRQLASTLDRRRQSGGARLDARLAFSPEAAATQRFRMRGMQMEALQSAPAQLLSFSLGGIGAPLTVSLEPGLSGEQIVQRFERALAPAGVRASLGKDGELVFSTPEANFPAVRDNLSLGGRGRVGVEEELPAVAPQRWGTGDTEALRLSLQEVVRALAQVRRSQEAASRELSAAASRAAAAPVLDAGVNALAQDFAATATTPDYDSLLAITSAMVGISRERVVALLGLR
jgi:hypothetical protein